MTPQRIMESCADGRMQDVREVLEEYDLPTSRREHRRVRARSRQESRKRMWRIGYARKFSTQRNKRDLQDPHVEGSSERAENWVVFVVSLYSTISKSISRASTRRLAVFPEPAGPLRMRRR